MKFWEAMKALEEGKKVRLKQWIGKDAHVCKKTICDSLLDLPLTQIEWYLNAEWELYEEPEQLLTFAQVVEGLKLGKKFRRKAWNCDERKGKPIHMGYKKSYIWDSNNEKAGFTMEDFESTDWVCVE